MEIYKFKKQDNVSLREKVTNEIRDAIIRGKLKPGSRIKESDIAEQMGVSRGPVRETIRQLEREGLLLSYPYKETIVADLDYEEIKDILLPIRFHLEWFVIQKYVNKMNDEFFSKLQLVVDRMESSTKTMNFGDLAVLDYEFHEHIIEFAEERTVMLTWKSISNMIMLHFYKNLPFYINLNNITRDHLVLIEKIKSKDLNEIKKELSSHITSEESLLYFHQSDD